MSSVNSLRGGFEGAIVLDAFSGSGALGLEALSRGAASALLCDCDRNALDALQRNTRALGIGPHASPSATVRKIDVLARPPRAIDAPYDLILLDPPYVTPADQVFAMLDVLDSSGSLSDDAIAVYEHSSDVDIVHHAGNAAVSWQHVQTKRYGETAIDYFRKESE